MYKIVNAEGEAIMQVRWSRASETGEYDDYGSSQGILRGPSEAMAFLDSYLSEGCSIVPAEEE